MPLRLACPVAGFDTQDEAGNPDYWIDIPAPDEWGMPHAEAHDAAIRAALAEEIEHGSIFMGFVMGMALLEDWSLPGMNGNPEKWDFNETAPHLGIIQWVSDSAVLPFQATRDVKKNYSALSLNGHRATAETKKQDGD